MAEERVYAVWFRINPVRSYSSRTSGNGGVIKRYNILRPVFIFFNFFSHNSYKKTVIIVSINDESKFVLLSDPPRTHAYYIKCPYHAAAHGSVPYSYWTSLIMNIDIKLTVWLYYNVSHHIRQNNILVADVFLLCNIFVKSVIGTHNYYYSIRPAHPWREYNITAL